MELSILIPTYNIDCTCLCSELSCQIDTLNLNAEIVVMDDASDDISVVSVLNTINSIPHCRLVRLDTWTSIAQIRNKLADVASGKWYLFLDSDVFPVSEKFLSLYLSSINDNDVISGGLNYRLDGPSKISPLRYAYGMKYEVSKNHFQTSNFLVSSTTFHKVRFDESFTFYGHEDTNFGLRIKNAGFDIIHISNPVYHDNIDSNEDFLEKTRTAIDSLVCHYDKLIDASRLLQFYEKIKWIPLSWFIRIPYKVFRSPMESNLLSETPSIFIYNVYKISYLYCRLKESKN